VEFVGKQEIKSCLFIALAGTLSCQFKASGKGSRRRRNDDNINDLDISRDLNTLFSGDSENVFLVKASYWWNL